MKTYHPKVVSQVSLLLFTETLLVIDIVKLLNLTYTYTMIIEAFKANGIDWAAQLTAFGEVFTLPVVVLISIVIQPRLQFALANDGLLPAMFKEIDTTGNPYKGALFAGAVMTIFATFVPL